MALIKLTGTSQTRPAKETPDDSLYLTKQELLEAENRCEGRIDWAIWDKVVAKTKAICSTVQPRVWEKDHKYKAPSVIRYVYDVRTGELLYKGFADEIANAIGKSPQWVTAYAGKLHHVVKKGWWISSQEETPFTIGLKLKELERQRRNN